MKDKATYLKELKQLLIWREETDEINEILANCNGYFEAGRAQGQTEEAICQQLGEPKVFIANLELKRRGVNWIWLKSLGAVLIPLWCSWGFANLLSNNIGQLVIASFGILVAIKGVWELLGKASFCTAYLSEDKKHGRKLVGYHSALLIMQMLGGSVLVLGSTLAAPYMGIYIARCLYSIVGVNFLIMLRSIYNYRIYSKLYYGVYIHAFGTIIYTLYNVQWLGLLSDVNEVYSYIMRGSVLYIITVLSILYFSVRHSKKGNKKVLECGRSI